MPGSLQPSIDYLLEPQLSPDSQRQVDIAVQGAAQIVVLHGQRPPLPGNIPGFRYNKKSLRAWLCGERDSSGTLPFYQFSLAL